MAYLECGCQHSICLMSIGKPLSATGVLYIVPEVVLKNQKPLTVFHIQAQDLIF